MKKNHLIVVALVLAGLQTVAQTASQSGTTASSAQIKAALSQKTTYHSGTGNILTASITGQLTPILQLASLQQQEMNDALNNYFVAKTPYVPLKRTNEAAYRTQQTALYAQLQQTLSGFLSPDQLSKFAAAKPPANTRSVLKLVYY